MKKSADPTVWWWTVEKIIIRAPITWQRVGMVSVHEDDYEVALKGAKNQYEGMLRVVREYHYGDEDLWDKKQGRLTDWLSK